MYSNNKSLNTAFRKGQRAAIAGQSRASLPYSDVRNTRGHSTWSRAFVRAWLSGFDHSPDESGGSPIMVYQICPDCRVDPDVTCPRNVDGECLECGARLCASHLLMHFRVNHCIILTWGTLLKPRKPKEKKRDRSARC